MLLELDSVTTYRGPAQVLRGISLAVNEDEVVCLVGRNGAGRATIIESITGLLPIRSGTIRFRNADITRLPPHKRAKRGIGYAPEDTGVFPELTVDENLLISRWLSETAKIAALAASDTEVRRETREVLAEFGLAAKRELLAGELAQGERKLLDVAVAYTLRPKLLFLDEPTSGVSSAEKTQIMDTVSSVVRSGAVTAVVIEHDMDVVFRYSDRIVMMHEGALLADGPPEAIRANQTVASILLGVS